jgi:hypothetical protein
MYGLINSALKDMIEERYGEAKWCQVVKESGVPEECFLSLHKYDDEITYSLVSVASKLTGESVDDCLEGFGEYWVLVTAESSYGLLMDSKRSIFPYPSMTFKR